MLGTLGVCSTDYLNASEVLKTSEAEYCRMMSKRSREAWPPARFVPPPDSQRMEPIGSLVLPAVPAAADQVVFTYPVPIGWDGILLGIVNQWNAAGFVEASGDITWRILQGRRFIAFYDSITTSLGNLAQPYVFQGEGISLVSGQLLQYIVNFAVGSAARLTPGGRTVCAFQGYVWPRRTIA